MEDKKNTLLKLFAIALVCGAVVYLKIEKGKETATFAGEWLSRDGAKAITINARKRRVDFTSDKKTATFKKVVNDKYIIKACPPYSSFEYKRDSDTLTLTTTGVGRKGAWYVPTPMFRRDDPKRVPVVTKAKPKQTDEEKALANYGRRQRGSSIPVISDIAPTNVWPGRELVINGIDFATNSSGNTIYLCFNTKDERYGTKVRPFSVAADQLRVTIPERASPVICGVRVQSRGQFSNLMPLTIIRPHIPNISPTNAVPGRDFELHLQGRFTHFEQGKTVVRLERPLKVKSCTVESPTSLKVQVGINEYMPLGVKSVEAQTGSERVYFNQGLLIETAADPEIDKVELVGPGPILGLDGKTKTTLNIQALRISGKHFHPNMVNTRVTLGKTGCVIRDITSSRILLLLPPSLRKGGLQIRVGRRSSRVVHIDATDTRPRTLRLAAPKQ